MGAGRGVRYAGDDRARSGPSSGSTSRSGGSSSPGCGVWLAWTSAYPCGPVRPSLEEIRLRFALSLQVAVMATVVATLLAIPLGVIAALKQDTWIDYAVRIFSIAGLATPSFWLGIVIILGLLIVFRWLPPMVYTPFWVDPVAEPGPAHLAGPRRGLSLLRGGHPDDALGDARSAQGGLHSDGQGQRPLAAS